jgi:hypothetical protein
MIQDGITVFRIQILDRLREVPYGNDLPSAVVREWRMVTIVLFRPVLEILERQKPGPRATVGVKCAEVPWVISIRVYIFTVEFRHFNKHFLLLCLSAMGSKSILVCNVTDGDRIRAVGVLVGLLL